MKFLLLVFIVMFPMCIMAQNSICNYYDINNLIYKKIVSTSDKIETLFYDNNGKELNGICKSNENCKYFTESQKSFIYKEISKSLKKDTTERDRSITFCFNISKKGVSNVRLLNFKALTYNSKEIMDLLNKVLINLNMKSEDTCEVNIELAFVEYVFYPIYKTNKTNGYELKQQNNDSCKSKYDTLVKKNVYAFVDEMPIFPGGNDSIMKFIANNFKYPEQDQFQAKFQLVFVIDTDGVLIGGRISNKSNTEYTNAEKEALRVLKLMPKWNPGKCSGKVVPVLMFLPLKF